MKKPAYRSNVRILTLLSAFMFCSALLIFVAVLVDALPLLEPKFESLRYRMLAMLPPPPHTEFVPTPLPTPTRLALARTKTPTPAPTEAPTLTSTRTSTLTPSASPTRPATSTPSVAIKAIQPSVRLTGITHDYQRWNNCGPTTLEMTLSYFGQHHAQAEIANVLKPDPEDKNVRPDEMAAYAQQDGLNALVRVNGSVNRVKQLLSNGLPVIVETGFDPPQAHEGWMGHYRLVSGYDASSFITQDSYDGPNVKVDFGTLDSDWRAFNRTYILVYTQAQAPLVQTILGGDMDATKMYNAAAAQAQREQAANPKDPFAPFNLGSSLVGLKRYDEAAAAFDQARLLNLPWRMLWYQFGPYEAYYQTGRYDEVIALANATLQVANDLEESHYYKGLALEALGQDTQARSEFMAALKYNKNYTFAQRELAKLQ